MVFWNWGPTTIWHNLGCVAFYFSKSLHPTVQYVALLCSYQWANTCLLYMGIYTYIHTVGVDVGHIA